MQNNIIRLSTKLSTLLAEIETRKTPISIGHMIHFTGSRGFGILILFLSLPSALPLPLATPFGIAIAILLIQMLIGRKTPWIFEKINKTTIAIASAKKMLKFSIKLLNKVEHLIHPRWNFICKNKLAYVILLILTCIMILPFPLTNTAPAMTLFLFSIGLIEDDGLVCAIAYFIGAILICFYSIVAYFILTIGINATLTLIKKCIHIL